MRSLSFPHAGVGNAGLGDVQKARIRGRAAGAGRNSRTWDSLVPIVGTSDCTGNEGGFSFSCCETDTFPAQLTSSSCFGLTHVQFPPSLCIISVPAHAQVCVRPRVSQI